MSTAANASGTATPASLTGPELVQALTAISQQNRNPAPGPAANGSGGTGNQSINLDTTVTYEGKEYKLSELLGVAKKASKLESDLAEVNKIVGHVKSIYGKGTVPQDQQKEAYAQLLRVGGYTEEEIAEEINKTMSSLSGTSNGNGTQGGGQQRQTPAIDPEVRQRLSLVEQTAMVTIEDSLRAAAREALGANPDFAGYLRHIKDRDGDEAAVQFLNTNTDQAYTLMRQEASKRLEKEPNGLRDILSGRTALAQAAVKGVVDKARLYLGDPKRLGRASSSMGGDDPFAHIHGTQPKQAPQFQPGEPEGDFHKKLDDSITDNLTRAVLEAAQRGL